MAGLGANATVISNMSGGQMLRLLLVTLLTVWLPVATAAAGDSQPESGYILTADPADSPTSPPDSEPPGRGGGGITTRSGSPRVSGQSDPVEGQPYTWEDGDRTLTVLLQPDLTVQQAGEIGLQDEPDDTVVARSSGGNIARKDKAGEGSGGQPVFRSEAGELMTLPGGVLLALDPAWSEADTDAFFADTGIKANRVSELGFVANGFFVETEPGFPSLTLANALAGQDGVELSSPNWWTEVPRE